MPVNYLKSLKSYNGKINSLAKAKFSEELKDISLIEATEIHYKNCGYFKSSELCSIDFVLKNKSIYPIRNIKLFFIYLKKRFEYPAGYDDLPWEKQKHIKPKIWHDPISYSAMIVKSTILPKLALQFSHGHKVKNYASVEANDVHGYVEIRILDYEIERTVGSSPVDLLFK